MPLDEAHSGETWMFDTVALDDTRVGDQSIAVAHIPEHDIFGNTPEHGQLEPTFIYNGPMWAVWLHYHPETKLLT